MAFESSITHTFSADGDSTEIQWPGGKGVYGATGTWGGGTLSLQFSFDGGASDIPAGTEGDLTDDGSKSKLFELPVCKLKLVLAGSSSPDIDAWLRPL